MRQAGHQSKRQQYSRGRADGFWRNEDLSGNFEPKIRLGCGAGDDDTGCSGHDQCGNLRHKTFTDRQQGIGLRRGGKGHALLEHADGQASQNIHHT